MSEARRDAVEPEQPGRAEDEVVVRRGVLGSVVNGLLWPFSIVVRAYRRFWLFLGFRPRERTLVSPARHSLTGRKRLHWLTRVLLSLVPRRVQRALGYPVSSSIGRCLSPEIRTSPTKPCGKGSKRKQDELDEDEEDEGQQPTWVEALTQELADDVCSEEDPDYEPSTVETESEEYRSHNDTESDLEVEERGAVLIKDVDADVVPSTQAQVYPPAV